MSQEIFNTSQFYTGRYLDCVYNLSRSLEYKSFVDRLGDKTITSKVGGSWSTVLEFRMASNVNATFGNELMFIYSQNSFVTQQNGLELSGEGNPKVELITNMSSLP